MRVSFYILTFLLHLFVDEQKFTIKTRAIFKRTKSIFGLLMLIQKSLKGGILKKGLSSALINYYLAPDPLFVLYLFVIYILISLLDFVFTLMVYGASGCI